MRILIIEDDEDVSDTLRGALEKAWGPSNVNVDCCYNVYSAREALSRYTYDLISMDLDLSGDPNALERDASEYEGIELLAELPQNTNNHSSGVLVVSGYAERPHIAQALRVLRRKDVLEKPHSELDFVAKVRSILETKDAFVIKPDKNHPGVDTYGKLTLDRRAGIYAWDGMDFSLTTSQYRILDMLAAGYPNVVPVPAPKFLQARIAKSRESLSVQISQVREQLRSIGAPGDIIRFDPITGYMLTLPLR